MTRFTNTGRDSWTHNAEQQARLMRDMPLVPYDSDPTGARFFRGLATGLGIVLAFYAVAYFAFRWFL